MIVLANDGISPAGKSKLENAGFTVITDHVEQSKLQAYINEQGVLALLVRSATTVRKNLIDACPSLRFIGRGGVGMDNIDVAYAREKGLTVANTPASSSQSVAELVVAQMFSLARSLYDSERQMPAKGASEFKSLKKKYAKGSELQGKTVGIVGFGRIGRALARYCMGMGMHVVCSDVQQVNTRLQLSIPSYGAIDVEVEKLPLEVLISRADFISLHIPKQADGSAVIGASELAKMKKGVFLINAARGGVIDEKALVEALDSGHVAGAALDVFENEPTPDADLLKHPKIALSPHIGAATVEAQERIGEELADLIIAELATA